MESLSSAAASGHAPLAAALRRLSRSAFAAVPALSSQSLSRAAGTSLPLGPSYPNPFAREDRGRVLSESSRIVRRGGVGCNRLSLVFFATSRKHAQVSVGTDGSKISAQPASESPTTEMAEDDNKPPSSKLRPGAKDATTPKRSPLTAREKLRAARVLSKYAADTKPASKAEFGSNVLSAIKEIDKGKKRSSGLPEAPTNLFDDSKRGLPERGWTFDLPVNTDVLFVVMSFLFISTVMFATTYVVWKVGAIHFNEY